MLSESDSTQERVEVSLLDSDDDDLFFNIIEPPPLPIAIASTSLSSRRSIRSLSPIKVEDDDQHADNPLHITAASEHCFPDFDALKVFFKQYAASKGFETRISYNGGVHSATHAGAVRCWCFEKAPKVEEEEKISAPSHPPKRTVLTKTSAHSGKQIKCGCAWVIKFCRREDGKYWLTQRGESRVLEHTGHALVEPLKLATEIDSLRNVDEKVVLQLREMMTSGMHCGENQRRFLESQHSLLLDRDLYHNLVKKVKRELGVVDSTGDFDSLLEWLQSEQQSRGAVARMRVGDDRRVSGVVYLSADMIHHLEQQRTSTVDGHYFQDQPFPLASSPRVRWG